MRYWISFDLGLRGDYEELYAWLDQQKAKECGDGVATITSEKSRDQLAKELTAILRRRKQARVYVINREEGGKFVLGKRKFASWSGYAQVSIDSGEET